MYSEFGPNTSLFEPCVDSFEWLVSIIGQCEIEPGQRSALLLIRSMAVTPGGVEWSVMCYSLEMLLLLKLVIDMRLLLYITDCRALPSVPR